MNVFWREMKFQRKSLIIWCIGMIAMIVAGMGKYAGLSSSGQSMNDLMAQMPKSLQVLMGIGSFDISTASGYYGGLLFLYLLLIGTIHAAMLGATILSKEERDKTAEFLFVKPISRSKIIATKLLAALMNVIILTLVTWLTCLVIVGRYSDGVAVGTDISMTIAGMFILQLLFLTIGASIAAVTKRPNKAASVSTGVLLLTFILSFAIDLNDQLDFLKYITPFKYFEAKHVMHGGGLDAGFVILTFSMIFLLLMITFIFYRKRDLKV
ncbi:ABC transporter permease subunit [Falsibacillus albus]|uniref:ABC transporter n=1 Tax=Falsibacillus albus TaxID=2478915 RepID=A0A3L7JZH4_9BACI|nr:ABC transporter permease subunit [Falsibacillus albus]RLQ93772.1 ABC transporter [Falsibacillus albus]